jgi:type IV secretory pathway VirB6-like protein
MEVQEVIVLGRIAVIFVMYQVMIFFVCGADDVWMGIRMIIYPGREDKALTPFLLLLCCNKIVCCSLSMHILLPCWRLRVLVQHLLRRRNVIGPKTEPVNPHPIAPNK